MNLLSYIAYKENSKKNLNNSKEKDDNIIKIENYITMEVEDVDNYEILLESKEFMELWNNFSLLVK